MPVTDEQAVAFPHLNLAAQRIALRLDDFDVERLEFERWRVANGRDPEWGRSNLGAEAVPVAT